MLQARDPIPQFRDFVLKQSILSQAQIKDIDNEVEAIVDDAVKFADESPKPVSNGPCPPFHLTQACRCVHQNLRRICGRTCEYSLSEGVWQVSAIFWFCAQLPQSHPDCGACTRPLTMQNKAGTCAHNNRTLCRRRGNCWRMSSQTPRVLGLRPTAAIAMSCQGSLLAQLRCPRLMRLPSEQSERLLGSVQTGSRDIVQWPEIEQEESTPAMAASDISMHILAPQQ